MSSLRGWNSGLLSGRIENISGRGLCGEGVCRVIQLDRESGGRVLAEDSAVSWDENIAEAGLERYSGSEWYRLYSMRNLKKKVLERCCLKNGR